jgi:hypothetical protein
MPTPIEDLDAREAEETHASASEETHASASEGTHASASEETHASASEETHASASSETVSEFCRSERVSLSMYYKMRSEGWGPEEAWIGTRVIITPEAKLRWRRQREAAAKLGIRRGLPAA